MSEIAIDRVNMVRLMNTQFAAADNVHTALGSMPTTVDGGIASALIGFLSSAVAEATGLVADAHRALVTITVDVLDDMSDIDEQIKNDLRQFTNEIEAG